MIVSTLINGTTASDFDEEVLEKIKLHVGTLQHVRDERMQVGIRNEKGEIYRAIGITGMNEFLGVIQHLTDIGLVDELRNATGARQGYDAIFCS